MQICVAVLVAIVVLSPAFPAPLTLVVPNGNTSTPGNSTDSIEGGPLDIRFQQIYGSGQFSAAPAHLLITEFALRAAPGTGPATLSAGWLDLYASTTPYFPNTGAGLPLFVTDTFATNLGPDNTLVFSGPLALESPGCPGPGVCPFDLSVPLTTPFLYERMKGRLLLDFHFVGLSGDGWLDARIFNYPPGGGVASLTAPLGELTGEVFTEGVITRFTYQEVPEPASSALLLGGLSTAALLEGQRRRGPKA
jgi:hypothetical protein